MSLGANKTVITLTISTAALVICTAAVAFLSPQFAYGGDPLARPTIPFVACAMLAGFAWLVAMAIWMRLHVGRGEFIALIAVGLILRGILFATTPILETDFYRYLWDGGVAAHGLNPYGHAPGDLHAGMTRLDAPNALQNLAVESGRVHRRINHPHLGTVYPPTAQIAFAAAHFVRPWSLNALRAVLFLCDAAAFGLLLLLLRRLELPLAYAAIYWWNPLLVLTTSNNAHMDVIALPFILGAIWFAIRRRAFFTGIAAGLAIGAKLWPLVLAPLFLKPLGPRRRARRWALVGCALVLVPMTVYMIPAFELGGRSGFFAYSDQWEMNDALFMLIYNLFDIPLGLFTFHNHELLVGRLARIVAAGFLLLVISGLAYPPLRDDRDLVRRCMWVVAALFFLSPTQFPWYYVWLLPFLALAPQPALLALTVMLPVYYLNFWYKAHGDARFFHNIVVWLEYAPVFALLAWDWLAQYRKAPKVAAAS